MKRLYSIAFGEPRSVFQKYLPVDIHAVEQWEKCDLLKEKISGSADTPIGKFIEYLCNSDWVKQGIPYADIANSRCPFCQQELPQSTYDGIKAFFDDSYERDLFKIKTFLNFYKENANELGTYKIIRADGKCVDKTLSEGEYNFISFLYSYYLVYGSQEKTGIARPKVVVIDDPLSSLDSNVLFIVSTLTKQIISDCKNDTSGIKQVFILTHNVYFHKEVVFPGSRVNWSPKMASFWIIKKNNNCSQIVDHKDTNPIQTSYELLWSELKDTESSKRITIFNTLRRILEYYFNVIGGLDYEDCINKFDGEEKIICKSLIACVHEGSHFITDDFVLQYESAAMNSYINVFKLIFEKMGHESHFKMMMRIQEVPDEEAL